MKLVFAAALSALAFFPRQSDAATVPPSEPIVTADTSVEGVYVFGKRLEGVGVSTSASEGVVSFAKFADRPLMRPGELVEVVPGLVATQHSGNTKANQYFLRGFNLDHGTDFSVSLDGAPLNLRSHGHGQGYLDLNGVIPEVIETIRYRKGPYYADLGDFTSAGAAGFQSFSKDAPSYVQATVGQHGYGRLLGVKRLDETSFIAGELGGYHGPYDNPDRLRKFSLMGRVGLGDWSLTGLAYGARTHANDQIPQRAVDSGLIRRLGALDTSDGARTSRFILAAQRTKDDGWNANLYVQRYTLSLFSNFTYFLRDPVNGDQFEQRDSRWVYGGSLSRTWPSAIWGWSLRAGSEFRYDDIGTVGLYNTALRTRLSTVREDEVDEYSGALWTDATRAFGPLRVVAGLRLDDIGGRVRSDDPRNSGRANDALLSPKLSAALRVSQALELYADAGQGFHSNDVRGATITVVPGSNLASDRVDLMSASRGGEVGARYSKSGFSATASLWALHLHSELVYTGDGGDTASTGATGRTGVELLVDYSPSAKVNLNISAAASRARYAGDPIDGDRIPNALEYVLTGGVTMKLSRQATVTLTGRHLGPAPLIEDNSARSKSATLFNGLIDVDFGRFSARLEALNLLDSTDDEIRYFYTSRLPGEPSEGVDDYHFHSFEPRSIRLSLRVPL